MGRDNYGHYVNDKGVEIRISTDKRGTDHIDIYDKCPADNPNHGSIHIKYDGDIGKGTIVDTVNDTKETTDVGCFLTTACMKHFQNKFNDNCYELTVLRLFRDNYIAKEDVEHYYKVAPIIVEEIEKAEENEPIYDYIYQHIVMTCVNAISQGNYEFAYNRYKNSVTVLEEQFVKSKLNNELTKSLRLKTSY